MHVDKIPVVHTPDGYWAEMPAPVLAGCTTPLHPDAPDLRGAWRTIRAEIDGVPAEPDSPFTTHVERVEQAGDRVVVCSGGVTHDMRADGTLENGVHDVSGLGGAEIHVVATFEEGRLVLRPVDMDVEVLRWREGDLMVWQFGPSISVWMERIDGPEEWR